MLTEKTSLFGEPRTEADCEKIQRALMREIDLNAPFQLDTLQTVAGVDLAYWERDGVERAVCCIVVLDFATGKVLEKAHTAGEIHFPYLPGYLAFRELPLVVETAKKLRCAPGLYVFDGNGYLHPRHMGIATHASFYLKTPTIGVAKSYYKVKDAEFVTPENEAGAFTDIVIDGETYGRAVRTHRDVRPIFLSAGNWVNLETATELVMRLVSKDSHIPLPTRLADLDTHEKRLFYREQEQRENGQISGPDHEPQTI